MAHNFEKLFVFALKNEWQELPKHYDLERDSDNKFLWHFSDHPGFAILQVGFGSQNAAEHFSDFVQNNKIKEVIHFGAAGGLATEQKEGEIFLPHKILSDQGGRMVLEAPQFRLVEKIRRAGLSYSAGTLFTSTHVLKNKSEKSAIAKEHQATSVDMESFPIAQICFKNKIIYTSARVIFDTINDNLEAIGEPSDQNGNVKITRVATNIAKHPSLIIKIPSLKRKASLVQNQIVAMTKAVLGE
ncbi:MAG: hypothetical protein H7A33_03110 [Deltaproteobacteria bacterium]|nr:hypothetical protein [Deltaproteobacteria bacterium]